MSISPHSEPAKAPTVLLCGDRWWLPGRMEPVPFADRPDAARAFVAAWDGNAPHRIRLVFHPEGFASSVTPCPSVGRRTLALALQEQFPGLDTADLAWSHDPILPVGDGFTTVLHREAGPWLFKLVAELEGAGVTVDSVWPLPTWLHALPEEWSESGAVTVLAAVCDCACAYRHPASGMRQIAQWPGDESHAPEEWLRAILAREPDEPVLVITAEAPAVAACAGAGQTSGLRHLPLGEALLWPATIPRKHPAQLLPPAPLVTAPRATVAASLAFLALAGASAVPWAMAHAAARTDAVSLLARERSLAAEVAHLRDNADEIAALRARLAVRTGPFAGPLLREIAASIPPEIALATFQATPDAFEARGFVAPNAAGAPLDRWQKKLATQGADRRIQADVPASGSAPFRLRGTLTP